MVVSRTQHNVFAYGMLTCCACSGSVTLADGGGAPVSKMSWTDAQDGTQVQQHICVAQEVCMHGALALVCGTFCCTSHANPAVSLLSALPISLSSACAV